MEDSTRPHMPKILTLDGGRVRGLSSLLILRDIMEDIVVSLGELEQGAIGLTFNSKLSIKMCSPNLNSSL